MASGNRQNQERRAQKSFFNLYDLYNNIANPTQDQISSNENDDIEQLERSLQETVKQYGPELDII